MNTNNLCGIRSKKPTLISKDHELYTDSDRTYDYTLRRLLYHYYNQCNKNEETPPEAIYCKFYSPYNNNEFDADCALLINTEDNTIFAKLSSNYLTRTFPANKTTTYLIPSDDWILYDFWCERSDIINVHEQQDYDAYIV